MKKLNRLVTAELQKNEEIPHFDHFPRPGESDPFVVVPNISAVTKYCKVLVPFRSVVIEDTVKFDVFNIKKYKV